MSNIHSASTLKHSIPIFSFGQSERFSNKKYEGFDSFFYKPETNFESKNDY
jgi:hypothetical protein